MKVEINHIKDDLTAIAVLEVFKEFVDFDKDVDMFDTELPEYSNAYITCESIMVNDDRVTIEFPDGMIPEIPLDSDDYRYIKIL